MIRHTRIPAAVLLGALALSACGAETDDSSSSSGSASTPAAASPEKAAPGSNEREVASLTPRVLISHEKGLTLVDTKSGKVLDTVDKPAFMRLGNAGDGRHVMVADGDHFRVYDAGIQSQPHGDHDHKYEMTPGLTKIDIDAKKAGHVVLHNGKTALFADGTGRIRIFDSGKIADPKASPQELKTTSAHHGVAVPFANGHVLTTQGTEDARKTVQVLDGDKVVAQTDDCPGVHGEAAAKPSAEGDVAVLGCENGPVVYRDGAFHKVKVKDSFSRSGNLAGHHDSEVVLGDYKVDGTEGAFERPTRVALIDTTSNTLKTVDLKSSYWFRSLARGPEGEGLVLTYDGSVRVIDVTSGKETAKIPAISPWKEKKDWQEPGPAIKVAGEKAYVTDAANKQLVVIDLTSNKVLNKIKLPVVPVEIAVVDGHAEAPAHETHGHDDHDHGHDGHDHDHDHDHDGHAHEHEHEGHDHDH